MSKCYTLSKGYVFRGQDQTYLRNPPAGELPPATKALYDVWDKMKAGIEEDKATGEAKSVHAEGEKQLRLGRIACFTALLEAVNFWHLLSGVKDKDTYLKLAASGASLCSSIITVTMTPFQALLKNSTKALGWKFAGSFLSCVSAILSAWIDKEKKDDALSKQQYDVYVLLYSRWVMGSFYGVALLIDGISAAGPLWARLATRYGTKAVMAATKVVVDRIAIIAGLRIVGWMMGWEVTIGLFVLQELVNWVTPDALEAWCSRCAFGTGRETILRIKDHDVVGYKDNEVELQSKDFVEAMTKAG